MKQLFYIDNPGGERVQEVLSFRIGEKHAGFAITNKSGRVLYQLAYCHSDEWNENELNDLLQTYPVLRSSFYSVGVAYDHPFSTIVSPGEFVKDSAAVLLQSVFAVKGLTVITEPIPEGQMCNIYGVPSVVREWVGRNFPAAQSAQQLSLGIKQLSMAAERGVLAIDFREDVFCLLAARQNQLLLARTFDYSTPEDVIYYLLRTCRQFGLSQAGVKLELSGLIDKGSVLYKELYQYFIHVSFREASWQQGENEYPLHFFTSLNDLSVCGS